MRIKFTMLWCIVGMEQPDKKVRYKPESGASGVFSDRFYIYNGANALNDEELFC